MKDKSGLIVSVLLMLCGAYALLTTLRSEKKRSHLSGTCRFIGDSPWCLGSSVFL